MNRISIYEFVVRNRLKESIESTGNYAIYPGGEIGKLIEKFLWEDYRIKPTRIFDANLSGCFKIEELVNKPLEKDEYIILGCANSELRLELYKKILMLGVTSGQIIDIFEKENRENDEANVNDDIYSLRINETNTVKICVPYRKTDFIQWWLVQWREFYEAPFLKFIHNFLEEKKCKKKCMLDIGANIGNHSLYFSKVAGFKKIICFEPVEDTFNLLKKNVEINNLENVIFPQKVGVGKKEGKAKVLSYNIFNTGGAELEESEDGEIKIVSVDELELESVDFVKIDTEGFEKAVIEGAINTLKKYHPIIYIEILDKNYEYINEKLVEINYKCIDLGYDNYLYY